MLALDATFTLQSSGGRRDVAAVDFFTGLFGTALLPGELLVEVSIPKPPANTAFAFDEVSRRHGDFALAGAAVSVSVDGAGMCTSARLALLSVADRPVLAGQAATILVGQKPGPEVIRAAADASADRDIDPPGDIHASSRYRRHLASVLTRRVLERAFQSLEPS
jgi:CO/xanthine dehydrogenase FAD-binding subunit